MGTFISPDTIVPDATNLFDYNRYMMVRGNPLKYNDPSGHGIPEFTGGGSCAQIGMCYKEPGQLQVNPPKPSTAAVLQQTAKALSDIEIPIEVSFEHGAPTFSFDHNKFIEAVSSPLIACAGAIERACGVAIGTSGNAAGAGVRGDLAVYADQHGNVGVFGEAGGGAYTPWPAPQSNVSITGIPGAEMQDLDGMFAQLGVSGAFGWLGGGAEAVFGRADNGSILRGQTYSEAQTVGAAAEGHFTFTWGYPILLMDADK